MRISVLLILIASIVPGGHAHSLLNKEVYAYANVPHSYRSNTRQVTVNQTTFCFAASNATWFLADDNYIFVDDAEEDDDRSVTLKKANTYNSFYITSHQFFLTGIFKAQKNLQSPWRKFLNRYIVHKSLRV